jgi:hypothetical protein
MTAPPELRYGRKPVPEDERASRRRAVQRQAERRHAFVVAQWLRRLDRASGSARR